MIRYCQVMIRESCRYCTLLLVILHWSQWDIPTMLSQWKSEGYPPAMHLRSNRNGDKYVWTTCNADKHLGSTCNADKNAGSNSNAIWGLTTLIWDLHAILTNMWYLPAMLTQNKRFICNVDKHENRRTPCNTRKHKWVTVINLCYKNLYPAD